MWHYAQYLEPFQGRLFCSLQFFISEYSNLSSYKIKPLGRMSPSPYLLHVNSRPTEVSNALWVEWYVQEHLPDLYHAKSCDRATFYEEVPSALNQTPNHPRKYLALYQTQFEELMKSQEYLDIRKTSTLFAKEGAGSDVIRENGDFDARYYSLLQEYDPNKVGESECYLIAPRSIPKLMMTRGFSLHLDCLHESTGPRRFREMVCCTQRIQRHMR